MNTKHDESSYPSALDFSGYFNIQDSEADEDITVLRTKEDLPPFSFDEVRHVYHDAASWLCKVLAETRKADKPLLGEEDVFVRDTTDDRTLYVDIPDFAPWNRKLLLRFQHEVVGHHPNWRVALVGDDAATTIMVYPEVVRVGTSDIDSDMDESIKHVTAELAKLREARLGPKRRRLQYLQQELPKAVSRIASRPFETVAVIAKANSTRDRTGIYLLFPGNDRRAFTVEGAGGPDEVWTGSAFAVDSSGQIVSEVAIPSDAAFCMVPWFLPQDYCGPIFIVDQATHIRHKYNLSVAPTSDVELKRPID